jgi:hypothetical protein
MSENVKYFSISFIIISVEDDCERRLDSSSSKTLDRPGV